jgi:hypothetical protein
VLDPDGLIGHQEAAGVHRVGDGRQDLDGDLRHGCDLQQAAELGGHHSGGSHLSVQGQLIDQEPGGRPVGATQDALLPVQAAGQPGGGGLAGDVRLNRDQCPRVVLGLQEAGHDRRRPVAQDGGPVLVLRP